MDKSKLIEVLKSLGIPVNEGIQNDNDVNKSPRIVFFEYLWTDIPASDDVHATVVTYQVSFYSRTPRDPKLILLKEKLNELGSRPQINHEFVDKIPSFHSFFQIDVIEDLGNETE